MKIINEYNLSNGYIDHYEIKIKEEPVLSSIMVEGRYIHSLVNLLT
jgi:hypothetical protein